MSDRRLIDRRVVFFVVFAAMVVGGWLRARGLTWGLPQSFYFDEEHVVMRALAFGSGDLNPHWFHKPALFFYLLFFEYGIYYVAGWATNTFRTPEDLAISFFLDPGPFFLIARLTVWFLGTATILLVYRLGSRVCGPFAGMIASWVFALNVGSVAVSKVAKADAPCAFFAVLASIFLIDSLREPARRKSDCWAGFFAGLGTATKYYPVVLGLPLIVAAFVRARRFREPVSFSRLARGPAFLFAGFFVGSPYNFLDSTWILEAFVNRFLPVVGEEEAIVNDATYAGEGFLAAIVDFFAVTLSPDSMGVVTGTLSLIGLLVLAVRGRGEGWMLLSTLLFFSSLCIVFNPSYAEPRHLVILFPIFAVASGALLGLVVETGFVAKWGRWPVYVGGGAFVVGVGMSLWTIVEANSVLVRPDPRNVARGWFEKNIPPGSKVVVDENHVKIKPVPSILRQQLSLSKSFHGDGEDPAFTRHLPDYYRYRLSASELDPAPRYRIHRFYHPWWKRQEESSGGGNAEEAEVAGEVRYTSGQDRRMGNPIHIRGVESLEVYLRRGYRYFILNEETYFKYLQEPYASRFPSFHRFYRDALARLDLVKEFRDPARPNLAIQIFRAPEQP